MDFFNTKEIKFNSITPKTSPKPAGSGVLVALIKKKKEQALAILFVVGTGFFLFTYLSEKQGMISEFDQKIADYRQKEKPIEEYKKIQRENRSFFAEAPQSLSENGFINEIASMASRRNVKIISYAPVSPFVASFYKKIIITVECVAPNFQDAMFFLKDIEDSPRSIRIDSWQARSDTLQQSEEEKKNSNVVSMQVTFSSIYLNEKNDKKANNK